MSKYIGYLSAGRRHTYINTVSSALLPMILDKSFEVDKAKKWFTEEEFEENQERIFLTENEEWVFDSPPLRRAVELFNDEVVPTAIENGFPLKTIEKLKEEIAAKYERMREETS